VYPHNTHTPNANQPATPDIHGARAPEPRGHAVAASGTSGVLTTRVGLQIPQGLDFDDWERAGHRLAGIIDSSAWWLGDWLNYGKDNYSERYRLGVRALGLKYQTLRNYAWVARRFDHIRRHARLTFQHHAEVASLTTQEQDSWLSLAEESGWSTKQLRNAIQNARGIPSAGSLEPVVTRLPPVPEQQLREWLRAAQCMGVELETWVLTTLDSAAKQILAEVNAVDRLGP
jgi:hypothetical protein